MTYDQNKKWNISKNIKVNQTTRAEAKEFLPNRAYNGKEYDEITLKNNDNDMNNVIKTL